MPAPSALVGRGDRLKPCDDGLEVDAMLKSKLTAFQQAARKRFPNNYKENGVLGDGRFAVLCCTFLHPSAGCTCWGELRLFETLEEARRQAKTVYCHAASKGCCHPGLHNIWELTGKRQWVRLHPKPLS